MLTMAPPSMETSSTGTSSTYAPTFPPCNPNFEINGSMPYYEATMSNNLQYVNGLYYATASTNTSCNLIFPSTCNGYGNITIIGPVYNYTISNIFTNNDAFTLLVDNRTNDVYLFGFFQNEQLISFTNDNFYGIKFNSIGVEQWRTPQFNGRLTTNTVLDQTKNVMSVYLSDTKYDVSLSTGLIVQTYASSSRIYRATLNYYVRFLPSNLCRMNLTDGTDLWCVDIPGTSAMVEDSNYIYVISESFNNTGSYFQKIDSSGNIILTSSIQSTFGLWEGSDYTNPVTYYNGYVYTMLNDCNLNPCAIYLVKTDINTGISTFSQFFYTGDERGDFVLAIDQTSNTLYFASAIE